MFNQMTYGILPQAQLGSALTTSSGLALNAAGTWLAFSFVMDQTRTLNTVKFFLSATAGTFTNGHLQCEIYNDGANTGGTVGQPSTSIQASTTISGTLTSNAWNLFTGFTSSLTSHKQYWIVFKNIRSSPASNNGTIRWSINGGGPSWLASSQPTFGWNKRHTIDSGGAWATSIQANVCGFRLGFADGTYAGFPSSRSGYQGAASNDVARVGARFITPSNMNLNVIGLAFCLYPVGMNNTTNIIYELWDTTPTLLGTTAGVDDLNVIAGAQLLTYQYFSSPIVLKPNTAYRAVIGNAGATGGTVGPTYGVWKSIDQDAASLALKPFGGTLQGCARSALGVWTDNGFPEEMPAFALLLKVGDELVPNAYSRSRVVNT